MNAMFVGDLRHWHSSLPAGALLLLLLVDRHLLQVPFVVLGEIIKCVHNDSRIATVVHVDRGSAHPGLQVVDGQRDVLRVALEGGISGELERSKDVIK